MGGVPGPGFSQDADRCASRPAGDHLRPARRPRPAAGRLGRRSGGPLERVDGDIDALITRLAHIRTWTYVAYRADWLDDALHWQGARAVEDALSDALHERLTQRFVDRRTQALLKACTATASWPIDDDGAIVVEGQAVGRVEGLRYTIQPTGVDIERRVLSAAAKQALGPELRSRAKALLAASDEALRLDDQGRIVWRPERGAEGPVGQLRPGPSPLVPRLELLVADSLHGRRGARSASGSGSGWTAISPN